MVLAVGVRGHQLHQKLGLRGFRGSGIVDWSVRFVDGAAATGCGGPGVKSVPPLTTPLIPLSRLKPQPDRASCGTAEAVPSQTMQVDSTNFRDAILVMEAVAKFPIDLSGLVPVESAEGEAVIQLHAAVGHV